MILTRRQHANGYKQGRTTKARSRTAIGIRVYIQALRMAWSVRSSSIDNSRVVQPFCLFAAINTLQIGAKQGVL